MKVAASTCVLPPQLGRELGLPTSHSTVSALWLYTRILGKSIPSLSPTSSQPAPAMVTLQKEGMALLQGTDRMLLAVHTGKTRPREGCGQAGGERTLSLRHGNSHFWNYRRDLSQAVIYWAATLFQTQG